MNEVPPHFHKTDRISEIDLIPDAKIYTSLPERAEEGRFAVLKTGSNYDLYRFIDGAWRQVGGSSSSLTQYALPGNGAVSGQCGFFRNVVAPSVRYTDNQYGEWNMGVVVPEGASTLSAITIYYLSLSAGNLYLAFSGGCVNVQVGATPTSDGGSYNAYAGAGILGNIQTISVPSTDFDGIGTITPGDLITLLIQRDATVGTDTYNNTFDVLLVEFTFS